MTDPTTRTLDVPGAVLHYDVRAAGESDEPVLLLVGSPMGADGFASLAARFADRTVVTYDPRSSGRSVRTDGAAETTPTEHADDLHRMITALDAGPVDVCASSGGAVNALVLVAQHPEQVRTLVAHEPPAAQEVPDREAALAACAAVRETYLRDGYGPAMAQFIALVSLQGPVPDDWADRPAPDPTTFGLPGEDDGSRDDALLGHNMVTCTHHVHDVEALRAASTRVVVAVGADSAGELAQRAGVALAERLGAPAVTLPGGHAGFTPREYGMGGDPDTFAKALAALLADGR